MCDPLGKNLLLPIWFTEDFEEEFSAPSLGIFYFLFYFFLCIGLNREESSTSLLETFWGRIFCFLTEDLL